MKRLRLWIKELSLSQQLLTIVFLVISIFSVFFFVFLSDSIDGFVENEMYKLIHRSQDNILFYVENNLSMNALTEATDANVIHILYDKVHSTYQVLGTEAIHREVIASIAKNMENVSSGYNDFIFSTNHSKTLYTISPMSDERALISLVSDSYRIEFRNALVSSVINLNVFVVGILFVILMLWVSSLIHPLNQIKTYIEQLKNDEKAQLKISRRDEIGEVADALVLMAEELFKAKNIREAMIQNISHDLKTPIATIKSYGESIKDGIYPYETLEKSVDVIIEHANRLEKKVYSLIMLNKMGYLLDEESTGASTEMKELIEKVILSLKVIRPEIVITPKLEAISFFGDEEPWRVVVENLLDNAIRYAKSEIVIELDGNELRISNDGPQMSEDRLSKLFRPYEKGSDGQFGLGLSIVHRVCTSYGFRVSAENLNIGVQFRIWRVQKNKKDLLKKAKIK